MAGRHAAKASGKSASVSARAQRAKTKGDPVAGSLAERLGIVERECDALRNELERARSRVRALEASQSHVRDRLVWALDSLQSILEGKRTAKGNKGS
jgi:hypothetical protein